ncbi:hypothetical protein SCB17_001945 [Clostridium perfringens]|uniref:hypothetical protein n=1 Tax=Clostridium perfringens TaxID=1502 RepID=UPI0024BC9F6C|nr:hypothetical protein [Clostridium perfringens]ELU5587513.1 hypothetical protein [Clostridium perfringens]MDU3845577.1 hypothetical protein [Clostridium perfringens]
MIKEKVLEVIRHLQLTISNKIDVASCYNKVTQVQQQEFLDAVNCYEGQVKHSFKESLYDKYVYALNAKFNGMTMFDYLMINGNFKGKRATSFKIYKTKNDDVERDF